MHDLDEGFVYVAISNHITRFLEILTRCSTLLAPPGAVSLPQGHPKECPAAGTSQWLTYLHCHPLTAIHTIFSIDLHLSPKPVVLEKVLGW